MMFRCLLCGAVTAKRNARCSRCGAWNQAVSHAAKPAPAPVRARRPVPSPFRAGELLPGLDGEADGDDGDDGGELALEALTPASPKAVRIGDMPAVAVVRIPTKIRPVDKVLSGGVVAGRVILISGPAGVGKSTLLLQILASLALTQGKTSLFLSAEESTGMIRETATRLGKKVNDVRIASVAAVEDIDRLVLENRPLAALVIDSAQAVRDDDASSGTDEIKRVTLLAVRHARKEQCATFLVSHRTKGDDVSGPEALKHYVDTVLYFEGEEDSDFRTLSVLGKNRSGAGGISAALKMTKAGLEEADEDE